MRILVVQLADIGDLILSTPALAALRAAHPGAYIALLASVHAAPVAQHTGLFNAIITVDHRQFNHPKFLFRPGTLRQIRALRCDTVVFLHHFTLKLGTIKFGLIACVSGARRRVGLQNGRGWFLTDSLPDAGFGAKHQAQYWLDLMGLLGAESAPHPAQAQVDDGGLALLPPYTRRRVIIHAGSGGYSLARRWEAEKFAAVADALHASHDAEIILVGGPSDDSHAVKAAMRAPTVDLTGQTTLPQLAAILRTADVFIGADSGVMHLAAATGAPVVALFGPSNHNAWGPWTPEGRSVVVRAAPECSPCSYVDHHIGLRDGCLARTCMRMLALEQVIDAAESLLGESRPTHGKGKAVLGEAPLRPYTNADRKWSRITILDLPVDGITYAQWLDCIGAWVQAGGRCHHVCTVNPEFVMIARQDVNFRHILTRADLCVPDGVGLLWAARRLGHPLPERVTGSDGVPIIAQRAAREGWKLFFLGAGPGVAEKAAAILSEQNPGLQVVGIYEGSPAPEEEDDIVARVNASGADILLVAYGAPKQDAWIARNLPRLNVAMAMGIGGSFDFIAGVIPRAPVWMRNAGLEWLYRLYLQPSRIGRMMRLPRFVLVFLWWRHFRR